MQTELISYKQIVATIVAFIFGSSVVMGVFSETSQDSWIVLLLALLWAIPIILIYARLLKLYPGKDWCEITEKVLGTFIGKIIVLSYVWYSIHLGALVLTDFSQFTIITSLISTPEIVIKIPLIIVAVYIAKSGVEVLGRWAIFAITVGVGFLILTIILSAKDMNFNFFLPIMSSDIKDIMKSSLDVLTFPLAETVLFLTIASSFSSKNSPYKIFLYSLLFGGLILLVVIIRNLTILGIPMVDAEYFPSYTATRLINIGDFLTRIEGTITINFIVAGLTKIAVCIIAASKGFNRLFNSNNYKAYTIPMALAVLAISTTLYTSLTEMFEFLNFYTIYAMPFQIIMPVIIWIVAEIKAKTKRSN